MIIVFCVRCNRRVVCECMYQLMTYTYTNCLFASIQITNIVVNDNFDDIAASINMSTRARVKYSQLHIVRTELTDLIEEEKSEELCFTHIHAHINDNDQTRLL